MNWTIVPIGAAVLVISPDQPSAKEYSMIRDMTHELIKITGIPWVFIGNSVLADEKVIKEIAERFYGIKR